MDNRIITALFREGECVAFTSPVYQFNYGQILKIEGIELPSIFEVQFANEGEEDSTTSIGQNNQVDIPDMFFESGKGIRAWIYLHDTAEDGETVYQIMMPIIERAEPSDIEPTPVQQDVITQAIAALDEAVSDCEEAVSHYPKINSETGNWNVWDGEEEAWSDTGVHAQGEQGEPGTPGADGKDGKDGADGKDGVDGKDGKDGVDGQNGQDGQDGFSPVVSVSAITGGHEVSITDASGTQTFDVMDGDPTTIIDDSSTSQSKVWSASKVRSQLSNKMGVVDPKYSGNLTRNTTYILGTNCVALEATSSTNFINGDNNFHFDNNHDNQSVAVIMGNDNFVVGDTVISNTASRAISLTTTSNSLISESDTIVIGGLNNRMDDGSENSIAIGGEATVISGEKSISIGGYGSSITGEKSVTLGGMQISAGGVYSVAIGGKWTQANGNNSVAIAGGRTDGENCVAIGVNATASVADGIAIGEGTTSNGMNQIALGRFNSPVSGQDYAEVFGKGLGAETRSNARTLDWQGNEWLAGKLTIGGTPVNNNDVVRKIDLDGKQNILTAGNGIEIVGDVISASLPWQDVNMTLNAGYTTLEIVSTGIQNKKVEIFDDLDVPYETMTFSTNKVTIVFEAQQTDMNVIARIS